MRQQLLSLINLLRNADGTVGLSELPCEWRRSLS